MTLVRITSVDFDVTDQVLIRYSVFFADSKNWECNGTVHELFVDFEKAYDSVRREVLYNIFIEFFIPMKLVRLITVCLKGNCSKVRIGKNLSDTFPIQNCLKQGRALSPLLFKFALEYARRKV
jgi:hypothetical protein